MLVLVLVGVGGWEGAVAVPPGDDVEVGDAGLEGRGGFFVAWEGVSWRCWGGS